jgi:acetyl-CoA carboxylase carboxyltransferase component
VSSDFAVNILTAFARLTGNVVAVIANNPKFLAGAIDINAAQKVSRFIRFCDSFSIPLITFVDTPGYLPGVQQEHSGIIKHGSKILYAYGEATVPQITIITRKAYGGSYVAMSSMPFSDITYAWPTAEIAVMGAEGAANIIFRKEIESSTDPEAKRKEKIEQYREKFASPYYAANRGLVTEVIFPSETRPRIISALAILKGKHREVPQRKHGNIPL